MLSLAEISSKPRWVNVDGERRWLVGRNCDGLLIIEIGTSEENSIYRPIYHFETLTERE